jgi:thiol-disulfide isomerase/thioredoxin
MRSGALVTLLLLCACGDPPANVAAESKSAPAAAASTTAPASSETARAHEELVPITHAQWQDKLRSYAPDIVVVDFWATWCTPCIERFPKMIAMAERYRGRGVRFVSMCMEDRDDRPAVAGAERFLAERHSPLDDFLLDEPLLDGFEDFGLLSVPAVHVYDRSGTLHTRTIRAGSSTRATSRPRSKSCSPRNPHGVA